MAWLATNDLADGCLRRHHCHRTINQGCAMMIKTSIVAKIDLSTTVEMLSDKERVLWMMALLETIDEEGTIDLLRSIVNNPQWNYTSPPW